MSEPAFIVRGDGHVLSLPGRKLVRRVEVGTLCHELEQSVMAIIYWAEKGKGAAACVEARDAAKARIAAALGVAPSMVSHEAECLRTEYVVVS